LRRFCLKSIAIGLGIGMILTASFNIIIEGRTEESLTVLDNQVQLDLENSIVNLKKTINDDTLEPIIEDIDEDEDIDENIEENFLIVLGIILLI